MACVWVSFSKARADRKPRYRKHVHLQQHMRSLLILVTLIVLSGCDTVRTAPVSSKRSTSNDGVARYSFHRDVTLADVTKTLPDGSVDYVDLDMADDPSVLVVVTASATPKDGLTFTTTFTGNNNLAIKKKWSPTTSRGDDEHVGIFILPKSINDGHTFRSRETGQAALDDIIF